MFFYEISTFCLSIFKDVLKKLCELRASVRSKIPFLLSLPKKTKYHAKNILKMRYMAILEVDLSGDFEFSVVLIVFVIVRSLD